MSFELVTEPIDGWPDPDTRGRAASNFTATYDQTIDLLRTELTHLGATGAAVIQVVTQRGAADLRRDGLLRARAVIDHPGVRLSITIKRHGPMTYATDAFEQRYYSDPPAWQSNLRAIALGLQDGLRHRPVRHAHRRGAVVTLRGLRAVAACCATGLILWLLVFVAAAGLVRLYSLPPAGAGRLPVCAVEDGSFGPLPCRWDGGPNGRGLRYVIDTEGVAHPVGD